jgi:hypothetical protein
MVPSQYGALIWIKSEASSLALLMAALWHRRIRNGRKTDI